jgi:hypothetical protein
MTGATLADQGRDFIAAFTAADSAARIALRQDGQKLARQWRSTAIGLASDKAAEFSPAIEELTLLAAEVALLAYGSQAPEFETFESGVHYYRNFTPQSPIVAAYDAFKRSRET